MAHIERCGVLAGAGQFGTAEQGIFSCASVLARITRSHTVRSDPTTFPWLILNSSKALTATACYRRANHHLILAASGHAKPHIGLHQILEEIADHAAANPDCFMVGSNRRRRAGPSLAG